jgi:hypothetical protein
MKMIRRTEKMNAKRKFPFHALVILALLALVVVSSGCIKTLQNTMEPVPATDNAPVVPDGEGTAALPETRPVPVQAEVIVAEMTPVKSDTVQEISPDLTPDPYPIIHGTRINQSWVNNTIYYGPYEFEKKYTLRGNATALRVNVAEGPLYVIYVVTPQNDCLVSPGSCKGDLLKPVNRPYLTITVRDNQTHDIIAEDGYAREYSSDIGDYEFKIESRDDAGNTVTSTTEPGPRVLKVYREGTFDITFEGNFLDVDVKVKTGATPAEGSIVSGSTPAPEEPEEEMW